MKKLFTIHLIYPKKLFYSSIWVGIGCLLLVFSCMAYEIAGVIYQPEGQPSVDTDVWLTHAIQGTSQTQTDKEGKFLFQGFNFGEITIVARDKNNQIGGCSFVLLQDEKEIKIQLIKGVPQKLRVYNPQLNPISGAFIRRLWIRDLFCIPAEELADKGFGWLRSNDEGIITLKGMPPNGFIRVIVSHLEYADTYLPFVPINEKKNMDIIMQQGTVIRGRVVKDGKGIDNVSIVCLQKGAGTQRLFLPVKTDKEGLYRLRLDKGEYRLFAMHPDYPNTVPQELSITNVSEEEKVINFELKDPLYLQGVVQLLDGTPCKLAKVTIYEENGVEDFVFTNEKGEYVLKSSSEKAKVRFFPPPGFITEILPEVAVDFKGSKKIVMPVMHVKKLPEIQGRVFFSDGREGDHVFISALNLDYPLYSLTDAKGEFKILFDVMPEVNPVRFVAEHALRFVKSEFSIDLFQSDQPSVEIKLSSFEPNQDKFVNQWNINKLLATLLDKPAPDIKCRAWFNYSGNSNPLRDLEGKVVLLLFWGGFDITPNGRKHIEEARALYDLYKDISDVQIFSVHDGTSEDDEVQNYLKQFSIEFPVGIDTDNADTFTQYCIESIPQFILIDKKGVIRYIDVEGRIIELVKVLRRL